MVWDLKPKAEGYKRSTSHSWAFALSALCTGVHFPGQLHGQLPALLLLFAQEPYPNALSNSDTAPHPTSLPCSFSFFHCIHHLLTFYMIDLFIMFIVIFYFSPLVCEFHKSRGSLLVHEWFPSTNNNAWYIGGTQQIFAKRMKLRLEWFMF